MKTQLKDIKNLIPDENGECATDSKEFECDSPELNQMIGWDKAIQCIATRQVEVVIDGNKLAGQLFQGPYVPDKKAALKISENLIQSKATWSKIVYLKEE